MTPTQSHKRPRAASGLADEPGADEVMLTTRAGPSGSMPQTHAGIQNASASSAGTSSSTTPQQPVSGKKHTQAPPEQFLLATMRCLPGLVFPHTVPIPTAARLKRITAAVQKLDEEALRAIVISVVAHDAAGTWEQMLREYLGPQPRLSRAQADRVETAATAATAATAQEGQFVHFGSHSVNVWNVLNSRYSNLSMSKQFDVGSDAADEIQDCIRSVWKGCLSGVKSYDTRVNTLETLCSIGDHIVDGPDELGSTVRKSFEYDDMFPQAVLEIVCSMSLDQAVQAGRYTSRPNGPLLAAELERVFKKWNDYCLGGKLGPNFFELALGILSNSADDWREGQRWKDDPETTRSRTSEWGLLKA